MGLGRSAQKRVTITISDLPNTTQERVRDTRDPDVDEHGDLDENGEMPFIQAERLFQCYMYNYLASVKPIPHATTTTQGPAKHGFPQQTCCSCTRY
mgnify:CR=1 FL=1